MQGDGVVLTLVVENPERRYGERVRGYVTFLYEGGSPEAGYPLFGYASQGHDFGERPAGCPGATGGDG